MPAQQALWIVFAAWGIAEAVLGLAKRAGQDTSDVQDHGSMAAVWAAIAVSLGAGVWLGSVGWAPMRLAPALRSAIGLTALIAGIALRVYAVVTLGRWFTTNVAIQSGQMLVRRGLYRTLRHPSYTGLILGFGGVGFGLGDWLGLVAIGVPITCAVLYRIRVEEAALVARFGVEYGAYRTKSKKLIPGVY